MTNFTTIDESNVSPWPSALRSGVLGGLVLIVYGLISNLTGFSLPTSIMGSLGILVVSIAVSIGVCVYAINTHKKQDLDGYITFGRAFIVGAVALAIASLLSGLANMVYINFVDPGYIDAAIVSTGELMEKMGAAKSDIEAQLRDMEGRFTPAGMVKQTLIVSIIFSAIIGLIVAAIMKNNKPAISDILDEKS